jgi:hypothetical protein
MKTTQLTLIAVVVLTIAACSSSKKSSSTTVSSATSAPSSTSALVFLKTADGIYAPGNEELAAVQVQYKEVTLQQLKEGHALYTQGACINCHGAINIYKFGETQWRNIVEDMAQRANITDVQKDAVYKYVLAIKATQPK